MTTRGTALALLGLMWIGRGLVIAHDPGTPNPDEAILHMRLDVVLRIGLWVGTGIIALAVCWSRHWVTQLIGWAAVVIMPAERAISYLWSLLMWVIPGAPGGTPWAPAYALWWVANVVLLLVMARWTEPQEDDT